MVWIRGVSELSSGMGHGHGGMRPWRDGMGESRSRSIAIAALAKPEPRRIAATCTGTNYHHRVRVPLNLDLPLGTKFSRHQPSLPVPGYPVLVQLYAVRYREA
eukprot:SAG31_NODE_239_length_19453_cov_5.539888_11_plen_103_part_00